MKIIQSEEFLVDPVVSVVIPSYNRMETLGEAIDSILNQICNFDFEIVIGDDFSTDNSKEILLKYQEKYPRNIKLLFQEENIGLGSNWAISVQNCRGKYITNCDNDDYWHNDHKLQIQVDYLETHLECGLLHTDYDELNVYNNKIIHNYLATIKKEVLVGYRQKEIFNGENLKYVTTLTSRLVENESTIALMAVKSDDKVNLLFACSNDVKEVKMNDLLKDAISLIDGKGGGSPTLAQGAGKNNANLESALDYAVNKISQSLN